MTNGRVYVHVEGKDLKSITYFDKNNKRSKTIDIDHPHKKIQPHVQRGYFHNKSFSKKGADRLDVKEQKMFDNVTRIWQNYLKDKGWYSLGITPW